MYAGTSQPLALDAGAGSNIMNGDTSSKLQRTTRLPSTFADTRCLPPTSCHTNGSTSRYFDGAPARLFSIEIVIVLSSLGTTFTELKRLSALMKFDSMRRELS